MFYDVYFVGGIPRFLLIVSSGGAPLAIDSLDFKIQVMNILHHLGDRWRNEDNVTVGSHNIFVANNTVDASDLQGYFLTSNPGKRDISLASLFPTAFCTSLLNACTWINRTMVSIKQKIKTYSCPQWTPLTAQMCCHLSNNGSVPDSRQWATTLLQTQFSFFQTRVMLQFVSSYVSEDILLHTQSFMQVLHQKRFFDEKYDSKAVVVMNRASVQITWPRYLKNTRHNMQPVENIVTTIRCLVTGCSAAALSFVHPCCTAQSHQGLPKPVLCKIHSTSGTCAVSCPLHMALGTALQLT
jgi:hypothetical protein